jgi:hypothetical protein
MIEHLVHIVIQTSSSFAARDQSVFRIFWSFDNHGPASISQGRYVEGVASCYVERWATYFSSPANQIRILSIESVETVFFIFSSFSPRSIASASGLA